MKRLFCVWMLLAASMVQAQPAPRTFPGWVTSIDAFPASVMAFQNADDICSKQPPVIPTDEASPWYAYSGSMGDSFCAGWLAAQASASYGGTCGDAKGQYASGRWLVGVYAYFSSALDLGERQISAANQCRYIPYKPSGGLVKQCTSSLFGCDLKYHPNRGVLLWPRVDVGGAYFGSSVNGLKNEALFSDLSGGFSLGYWWSPRNFDFRLLTAGVSAATGRVTGRVPADGSEAPKYSLVRASVFGALLQNLLTVEVGVYTISADPEQLPEKVKRSGNFFRVAINIADLPNAIGTGAASQASNLLQ